MRPILPILIAGFALACAEKTPPSGPEKRPCTLRDTSGCAPRKATPRPTATPLPRGDDEELTSFYEGSTDESFQEPLETDEPTVVEKVIGEEVEEEISKAGEEKLPTFDIPIVINKQVEKWIDYFQFRGRKFFANWLARSEKYIPMMKGILKENGLPEDLIYLAMIESGFKPFAYSPAKASGPWQFIKQTGQIYGLRVNWWIDERRDPEKSTIAAAQHLKDLHDQFNSWYLAAAGYNAGQGKVSRAIERYNTEDFWEMSRYGYLKPETKNYVPKIIAAALMAKDPERYGFTDIAYEEPLVYDKVEVPEPTELSAVASALGIDTKILVELNPELRRNMTPPDYPNYELKVPKGLAGKFEEVYPEIRRNTVSRVVRHVVKKRETMESIAKEYGVGKSTIVAFNRLKSASVRRGQQLGIPIHLPKGEPVPPPERVASRSKRPKKGDLYRVRTGDTLWSISRRFDVSVSELRRWNNLRESNLRPGTKLKVFARSDPSMIGPSSESRTPAQRKR